jgi:tetratricopeptide (TPR) repeat protein
MSTDRVAALEGLLAQDPNNSFVRYGLAQAYAGLGRLEDAVRLYRELIQRDGNYVAAFYHAGQTLEKLGRAAEARAIYEDGIAVCERTGDMHTRSEMEAALSLLG